MCANEQNYFLHGVAQCDLAFSDLTTVFLVDKKKGMVLKVSCCLFLFCFP